ncbi:MAG: magnesium/cobalt transporter CorA, partial [bacterium]
VVLDGLAVKVEALENDVLNNPAVETLQAIQQLKRDLIFLRRSVWPLREVVNVLVREEHPLISDRTEVFLRDVYDHTIQVIDTLESYRDAASGLLDIYLSSVSNRTNEVMKVLTIVASIFIPLTFIAGIYGMNFENMPELRIPWAYPLVWIVMILVALGMFLYVRKKGWL